MRQRAQSDRRGDREHRPDSPSRLLCTNFKARPKTNLTRPETNRLDQAQEGTLDYLKEPKSDTTTALDFSKSNRELDVVKLFLNWKSS
jgi:hypothetical protein